MDKKKKSSFAGKVGKDSHRQQTAGSSYGYLNLPKGISVFSPDPDSKVILDFMPYEVTDKKHPDRDAENEIAVPGTLWYKRPFKVHRSIGSDNDTVVCLASFGKPCPICEYRAKRQKEGADKEELDALKQSMRNLYVVIPIDSKKHEHKPHVFDISQFLFQNLLNDELEENPDMGIFPDLEEGLSVKIRFDAGSMKTAKPYAEASRIDFIERKKPYKEDILEECPNLDIMLKELTYAQLDAKFLELDAEEKDEADEDEPARKPKTATKKEEDDEDEPVTRTRKPEPKEAPKPTRKPKEEPEPEPEDDKLTWDDLEALNETKLKRLIKAEKLDVDPDDYDDDVKALRKAIAQEMDISFPKPSRTNKEEAPSKKGKKEEPECPHGHEFGVDTDTKKQCDDCKLWDACIEAKERN